MAIKYYLQPNPITPDPNDQSARVDASTTLDVEAVIRRMLRRGTMVTETDMKATLDLFFDEATELVAEGNSLVLPIANVRPSIRGVFRDVTDTFDSNRHKLGASLSAGLLLNEKMAKAKLEKVTSSLPTPSIMVYEDINSATSDSVLTAGGIGKIVGEELKFDMSQADEGIFFIAGDGTETRVTVVASASEGQVMFMVPALPPADYTLEVRKAYTSSRVIRKGALDHQLTVGGVTE